MKRMLLFAMLFIFATSSLFAKGPDLQNSEIEKSFKLWKEFLAKYDAVLVNYDASSPKAKEMEKKVLLSYARMREAYSTQYSRCAKMYKNHMDAGIKKGAPMVKELELEIENLKIIGSKMKSSLNIEQQKELLKWMNENNIQQKLKNVPLVNNKPGDRLVRVINGVEFAFRWCPAGSFMMGSRKGEKNHWKREHLHNVTLSKGFWMLETPVTQKQWKAVMHTNPSHFKGDNLPVETVDWFDCQKFCSKCEELGLPVALPSEAQWEYACRSGSTGPYAGNLDEMAWHYFNANNQTHPVGTKKPNNFNLYDMHGNVWEWCEDAFLLDISFNSNGNPIAGDKNSKRLNRGGSWRHGELETRSAFRLDRDPDAKGDNLGFRIIIKQEK